MLYIKEEIDIESFYRYRGNENIRINIIVERLNYVLKYLFVFYNVCL